MISRKNLKSRILYLLLAASLACNFIFFFSGDEESAEEEEEKPFELYPTDHSSLDFPLSYEVDLPQFRTFSPDGDTILFADFTIKGTIADSFSRKYERKISKQLVKNIQEIIYFLNGFRIRFREGDRLTFFWDEKSEKILWLQYKNSYLRTISDVYFFNSTTGSGYFTADGQELQPCITNGPFRGCPKVRFAYEGNNLVPVFETGINEDVRLPFTAKITDINQSRSLGGTMEFIYSNYATRGFMRGFASVNPALRINGLYKKDALLGSSGYIFSDQRSGVIYYLRKSNNTTVSPFTFHHTERHSLSEKNLLNFQIIKNFYSKATSYGKNFEKEFF